MVLIVLVLQTAIFDHQVAYVKLPLDQGSHLYCGSCSVNMWLVAPKLQAKSSKNEKEIIFSKISKMFPVVRHFFGLLVSPCKLRQSPFLRESRQMETLVVFLRSRVTTFETIAGQ